jgi:hypothetical protein
LPAARPENPPVDRQQAPSNPRPVNPPVNTHRVPESRPERGNRTAPAAPRTNRPVPVRDKD